MNLSVLANNQDLLSIETEALIVFVSKEQQLSKAAQAIENAMPGLILDRLNGEDLREESGQHIVLFNPSGIEAKRLVVMYLDSFCMERDAFEEFQSSLVKSCHEIGKSDVSICLEDLEVSGHDFPWLLERFSESFTLSAYQFNAYKLDSKPKKLTSASFVVAQETDLSVAQESIKKGLAIGEGKNFARNLGDLPPNVCNPSYLAKEAIKFSDDNEQVSVKILNGKEMAEKGMNALLCVGKGSIQPSKLIVLEYKGGKEGEAPYALVGKGITFDSGGISIKPGAAMDEMKYDMCGAASVLGTMVSVVKLGLPINVVCVVAAAENMPSANATRPGDIIKSMSGKTIEILNTDAEGRLVLCDALTFVQEYKPATIIDVATLTGACIVALGGHASGLFSNDEEFADQLKASGEQSGDRVWQLPIWPEYTKQLKSPFADLANIGSPGGGSIVAACFLAEFVKGQRWAHLDIAGTAWKKGSNKGATGASVGLMTTYLMNR
ncbi:leucyl aminopeptidase [Pseudocolwellia agarivorans]|uniref:leucyl aminopeptidase n=1 Tax=Pseudocolwellia agarivorans TaxID=1911682 RepID=UPI0009862EB8|nr:leucyl aminopeptidase [Pseudocolwellia agarivorans]